MEADLLLERTDTTKSSQEWEWLSYEGLVEHYKGNTNSATQAVAAAVSAGRTMADPNRPGIKDALLYYVYVRSKTAVANEVVLGPALLLAGSTRALLVLARLSMPQCR